MTEPTWKRYRRVPELIEAVQWHPDPAFGVFEAGAYRNVSIGTDALGIEYTVCDVGLRVPGRGFVRIFPSDWLCRNARGQLYPIPAGEFAERHRDADPGEVPEDVALSLATNEQIADALAKRYTAVLMLTEGPRDAAGDSTTDVRSRGPISAACGLAAWYLMGQWWNRGRATPVDPDGN